MGKLAEELAKLQADRGRALPNDQQSGSSGFARFLSRSVTPLVDLPDQSGPLGILERGVESLTSPVGLASALLVPVTGGTSLGLTGAAGLGARLGTQALAETAVASTSLAAAEKAQELTRGQSGLVQLGATALAGIAAGGGTSAVLRRSLRVKPADYVRDDLPDFTNEGARNLAKSLKSAERGFETVRKQAKATNVVRRQDIAEVLADNNIDPVARISMLTGSPSLGRTSGSSIPAAQLADIANISPQDIQSMAEHIITQHNNGIIDAFTAKTSSDALLALMTGEKQFTPGMLNALDNTFGRGLTDVIESQSGIWSRMGNELLDVANVPRSLMASVDMSAPLRQGILMIGHPVTFTKNVGRMVRAFGDERYARATLDELGTRANRALYDAAGLELTHVRTTARGLAQREEMLMSRFASRIPVVRASERAYSVFLNRMRADVFDDVIKNWGGLDNISLSGASSRAGGGFRGLQDVEDLGKAMNVLTGRAPVEILRGKSGRILNALFFAPQLVLSRFMAPGLLFSSTPAVRKEVARNLGAFVATGLGVTGLMALAGARIELNPRSTDFGKGRWGDTRIDFWGGYQQIARTTAQMVLRERKTATGDIVDVNSLEVFGRFLQSKLSPLAGAGGDVVRGETYIGQKVSAEPDFVGTQIANRLTPLFIQDVMEAFDTGTNPFKVAAAGTAFFGANISSYSTLSETKDLIAQQLFDAPYNDLTGPRKDIVDQSEEVVSKDNEMQGVGNSIVERLREINTEKTYQEQLFEARRQALGFESRAKFADAIEELQRIASIKKEEAALTLDPREPQSNLQQALQDYYDLFDLADYTAGTGTLSGIVDWSKFDQLERDLYSRLTPEEIDFVENRRRAPHAPEVQWYYDNKEVIDRSKYYDVIDDVFQQKISSVHRALPGARSYSDLLRARTGAELTGDRRLFRQLDRVVSSIEKRADILRKRLRKRNPELDRALWENGRINDRVTRG